MSGELRDSWVAWREKLNAKLNKYNPVPKTENMTVPVGIDGEGKLWTEETEEDLPYVKFESNTPLTIARATSPMWTTTGVVEYSFDNETWTEWPRTGTIKIGGNSKVVYLRGKNNKYFGMGTATSGTHKRLIVTGTNVKISGNIEGLLDYTIVENKGTPDATNGTFRYLFEDNLNIVDASKLKFTRNSLPKQYMESMFRNNTNLLYPPKVIEATSIGEESCGYSFCASGILKTPKFKAKSVAKKGFCGAFQDSHELQKAEDFEVTTTTGEQAFNYTFWKCLKLKNAPSLSSITSITGAYTFRNMFGMCESLISLPKFNVKSLPTGTFYYVFSNCPLIKLNYNQTSEYKNMWRIPYDGGGVETGSDVFYGAFSGTGGVIDGGMILNTIYYTTNEIVG